MNLTELTLTQACDAIASGRVGPVEYADALLAQAQRVSKLNVFIEHNAERVRAVARSAEQRRGNGAAAGV
ncbi:MAG: Asp-tRNA(Asn)/Glu-tRNA(Gln) amidotransferase GatCAB subunit A, partial [Lautropia sp.]|nr:Asp-tRNA(Asn)/Glu-tRNA(Gln) amidotransferase GatCAB subunit A [Lautropia sp.]